MYLISWEVLLGKVETYRNDDENGFGPDIGWGPPEVLPGSDENLPELSRERCNEFLVLGIIASHGIGIGGLCDWKSVQVREFLLDILVFGRVAPDFRPIGGFRAICRRLNHLEHVFRGVGVRRTRGSAVSLKVFKEGV